MSVVKGDEQTATVASPLPLAVVVRVSDAKAVAVPQQIISWVVVKGGGSVFAGTSQTNSQGEARERWTLGPTAGEQILEARAVDPTTGDPIVFSQITAQATPGTATLVGLHSDSLPRGTIGDTLTIRNYVFGLWDQFGNSVDTTGLKIEASFSGDSLPLVDPSIRREFTDTAPRGEHVPLDFSFDGYVYVWVNGVKLPETPYGFGQQSWPGARMAVYP